MNTLCRALTKLSLVVGSLVFVFLLGEVAARGYYRAKHRIPLFQARVWADHEFGWGAAECSETSTLADRVCWWWATP